MESYYDGIGAELRAERLRCGLSLETVSQKLRIRLSHLEAIEDGRFGDLPGRIYAIGFMRSYAEFLGADGDVCVSMFKSEVGPDGHSRKLTFPVPPQESRRPGWGILLISLILAGAVYGGWYAYQDSEQHEVVSRVPAVPERFVEQVAQSQQSSAARDRSSQSIGVTASVQASELSGGSQTGPVAAPVVAGAQAVAEEAAAVDDAAVQSVDLAVVGRNQPASGGSETASPNAMATSAADETETVAEATAVETVAADGTAGSIASAVQASRADAADAAPVNAVAEETASGNAAAAQPLQVAAIASPPPVPEVAPASEYVPRVLGISNRDSRVTIRAIETSQIIVKQAGGGTLLPHRVMQPGDTYRAPNRDGVILQSANIGGLEILVDGQFIGKADALAAPADALALDADLLASLR